MMNRLLVVYAILNAILYSALLPLWEGFDEPFHFAYVQQLATGGGFPDARNAILSREIYESLLIAPASSSVKLNLPQVTTYEDFFAWPPERKSQMYWSLRKIPPIFRRQPSFAGNYEAHHPPLAYLLLAGPEHILAAVPLPARVLWLRIIAGLTGSLLLYAGAGTLSKYLRLDPPFQNAVLFCVLSSQMTWATLAHVANDWLAVPLAIWTLVFIIRYVSSPNIQNMVICTLLLCAGLLTKAYFLALLPLWLAVCLIRRRLNGIIIPAAILGLIAAPWYLRNYLIYNSISGMQESRAGIGISSVVRAAPRANWTKIAIDSAHSALWTGNNTFRTFQLTTLNILLFMCLAGLCVWACSRHYPAEWVTAAYLGIFTLAMAYAGVVANLFSHGITSTPAAWYLQVLVIPALTLAFLGACRWRHSNFGRWSWIGAGVAAVIALLFGYVLLVTYVFKLIPLYGGYTGRTSLQGILVLYGSHSAELNANLSSVTLAPTWLIFGLTAAVLALMVAQLALLIKALRN